MKSQLNPVVGAIIVVLAVLIIGYFVYKANRPLHEGEDTGAGKAMGVKMYQSHAPGKPLPGALGQ